MIDETIRNSHKIVIKIGSSTLTNEDGFIDKDFIENLALQIETLRSIGKQVVIVSSGARIAEIGRASCRERV